MSENKNDSIPFFQPSESSETDYLTDSDEASETSSPEVPISIFGRLLNHRKRTKSDLETYLGRTFKVSVKPKSIPTVPQIGKKKQSAENINTVLHRCEPGFYNLGNTCYMNASLQCLLHCVTFVQQIRDHGVHTNGDPHTQFCILDQLHKLVTSYFEQNAPKAMSLGVFVENVRRICPFFVPGHQQDADEFIQVLFQALDLVQCNGCADGPVQEEVYPDEIGLILRDSVLGYMTSTITCSSCQVSSTSRNLFTKLSLPARLVGTLEESLATHMGDEILEGENAYQCLHCHALSKAVISKKIDEAPNLLIVQMNRFDSIGKVDAFISYPKVLDLSEYCSEGMEIEMYELVSVLTHHGPSTDFGHYTADVKCSDGHWCHVNDHKRSKINAAMALSNRAYMLFYQKRVPLLQWDDLDEHSSVMQDPEVDLVEGSPSPIESTLASSRGSGSVADVVSFDRLNGNEGTAAVVDDEEVPSSPKKKSMCCTIA
ncbi:Ubiquitin carboxyl-terminal hydrolase [Gracilaria domingensis]|nr:Ubiquitin carboxyl-terminal hydrolase [Gracilaria domingensis]